MVVHVESRSNLEMFSERKSSVPRDGLTVGSEGEGSVKCGTFASGLHNRMAGHIIPPAS